MLREEKIRRICSLLKEYDRDILEIVIFGSSVYAPELPRDVDLLVITRKKKEYGGYLDGCVICICFSYVVDCCIDCDVLAKIGVFAVGACTSLTKPDERKRTQQKRTANARQGLQATHGW